METRDAALSAAKPARCINLREKYIFFFINIVYKTDFNSYSIN